MFKLTKKYFCMDLTAKLNLNQDINIAKKQIWWRIRNMGQLELEIILMRWWEKNHATMTMEEMKEFTKEVLEKEIPDLNVYFVNFKPAPESLKYTSIIQKDMMI